MADHPIRGMMDTTIQRIREMVDASTVIGDAISVDGATIIPVSKISYGFASGGSDLPSKNTGEYFGGGGGAGVTVSPVGFLVISGGKVEMLQFDAERNSTSKFVDMVPDLVEKVSEAISSKKDKKDENKKSDRAEKLGGKGKYNAQNN